MRVSGRRRAGGLGVSPGFSYRAGGWEEGPPAEQNGGTERREGNPGGVAEPDAIRWLAHECNLPAEAAEQVVRYVREHDTRLSGLSKREALKNV